MRHYTVASEAGTFFGWPANGNLWHWGDEVVAMFTQMKHSSTLYHAHHIDPSSRDLPVQARSLDGGKTWKLEREISDGLANGARQPVVLTEPIDFCNDDFAMVVLRDSVVFGTSKIYYSYDRCKTWFGPVELPLFGEALGSSRSCFDIQSSNEAVLYVTGSPQENTEFGTHVFSIRTADGGLTWTKVSNVGPDTSPDQWYSQPSIARLTESKIVCVARFTDKLNSECPFGLLVLKSDDNGESWNELCRLDTGTTPPDLKLLSDGRLLLTYGHRTPPYGIAVRYSSDEGKTWSDEAFLRDDGGDGDIGYARCVFLGQDKLLTIYYYSFDANHERTIEGTIWNPLTFEKNR